MLLWNSVGDFILKLNANRKNVTHELIWHNDCSWRCFVLFKIYVPQNIGNCFFFLIHQPEEIRTNELIQIDISLEISTDGVTFGQSISQRGRSHLSKFTSGIPSAFQLNSFNLMCKFIQFALLFCVGAWESGAKKKNELKWSTHNFNMNSKFHALSLLSFTHLLRTIYWF